MMMKPKLDIKRSAKHHRGVEVNHDWMDPTKSCPCTKGYTLFRGLSYEGGDILQLVENGEGEEFYSHPWKYTVTTYGEGDDEYYLVSAPSNRDNACSRHILYLMCCLERKRGVTPEYVQTMFVELSIFRQSLKAALSKQLPTLWSVIKTLQRLVSGDSYQNYLALRKDEVNFFREELGLDEPATLQDDFPIAFAGAKYESGSNVVLINELMKRLKLPYADYDELGNLKQSGYVATYANIGDLSGHACLAVKKRMSTLKGAKDSNLIRRLAAKQTSYHWTAVTELLKGTG